MVGFSPSRGRLAQLGALIIVMVLIGVDFAAYQSVWGPPGPGMGVGLDEDWLEAHPWRDDASRWRQGDGYIASMQDTHP